MRSLLITAAAAATVAIGAMGAANASPAASQLTGLNAPQSNIEHVHGRRCYWHRGHRHCERRDHRRDSRGDKPGITVRIR